MSCDMTKEVMKQALEAFEEIASWYDYDQSVGALASSMYEASCLSKMKAEELRQAIAQAEKQEQGEPVAWFRKENGENIYYATKAWDDCLPLYTTPQTKKNKS